MSNHTGHFAATRWTLVVQARGGGTEARSALSDLCAAYYAPVVSFLRATGRDEDSAREMAHAFFAGILEGRNTLGGADPARGRFRSYLLGAVKHFLADQHERAAAVKRGSGVEPLPLDASTPGGPGFDVHAPPVDETVFDRQWALTVLARALRVLGDELAAAGKCGQFEVLKPWLTGGSAGTAQAEAASQLGMSEAAVKVAIHRLRQRFREAVKAEIAETVPAESDIDDELRHLIAVMAR